MRIRFVVLASLAVSATAAPGQPWHHNPGYGHGQPITDTVDLGYSKYQGSPLELGVTQWLGIQYAVAPIGDLRWRAPQPVPVNNSAVLPAFDFAPICVGSGGLALNASVNEDCLYLNVFAPSNAKRDSKFPVWFFIQGGGYAGDEDENFNATDVVIKSNYSMVFVQINYRVGAFGFLASEKIRENGDLNVGLLDQHFALEWTQRYIHLFGGNPDHVVIHGDSAGAGSVSFQMTAYGGRNEHLFVGAMAESPFWPTHRTVAESEFQFNIFAANVSCADAPDVLKCLRSKDIATLQGSDVASAFPGRNDTAEWYFLPVIDGTFSPDYLYNLFEQGKVVPVPLVVGDDTDEGTGFSPNATTDAEFLTFIADNYPKLSETDLNEIKAAYPENGFGSFPNHAAYFAATESAYGELTFICPSIEMANSLAAYKSPQTTWQYRWNVEDQETVAAGLGVPHVSEQVAIFGVNISAAKFCDGCSYKTYNAEIVPIMMDYWLSFVRSLDPNTHKNPAAPTWEPWVASGSSALQRLKLQTNATTMELVPEAQLQRCELWKSLADVTEQ